MNYEFTIICAVARFLLKLILYTYISYLFTDSFRLFIKGRHRTQKHKVYRSGALYYLFDYLPNRLAQFCISHTNNQFDYYGMIIFCGSQGSGKTYAMTHELHKIFLKYPDTKFFTNYDCVIADGHLDNWTPLLYEKNGDNGIVFCFDEISLWFNSRFRDLPPDILPEIVQNRKNHRVIYGTAQNISMVDKQIRLQSTLFINMHTVFDFITFGFKWKPSFDFDGNLIDKHFMGICFYLQDDVIRASYDTFATIQRLGKLGFNYTKPNDVNITVKEVKKK